MVPPFPLWHFTGRWHNETGFFVVSLNLTGIPVQCPSGSIRWSAGAQTSTLFAPTTASSPMEAGSTSYKRNMFGTWDLQAVIARKSIDQSQYAGWKANFIADANSTKPLVTVTCSTPLGFGRKKYTIMAAAKYKDVPKNCSDVPPPNFTMA